MSERVNEDRVPDSPKTPRGLMARVWARPRSRFGCCCLTPPANRDQTIDPRNQEQSFERVDANQVQEPRFEIDDGIANLQSSERVDTTANPVSRDQEQSSERVDTTANPVPGDQEQSSERVDATTNPVPRDQEQSSERVDATANQVQEPSFEINDGIANLQRPDIDESTNQDEPHVQDGLANLQLRSEIDISTNEDEPHVQDRGPDSPKTPRSLMARVWGRPRSRFGCCYLTPPANRDQPIDPVPRGQEQSSERVVDTENQVQEQSSERVDATTNPVPRDQEQSSERVDATPNQVQDPSFEIDDAIANLQRPEIDESTNEDELHVQSGLANLQLRSEIDESTNEDEPGIQDGPANQNLAIAELRASIVSLTTVITTNFAKDPLEALKKERDEVSKFILLIGGLTLAATLFAPPGGLDSNGYIRFRNTLCFRIFCMFNELTFMLSYANLAQLHTPLVEEDGQEKKVKALKRKIRLGWFGLWCAVILFFGAFNVGFWIVYPANDPPNPISYKANAWPRWVTLGLSITKVVGSLAMVFGRRLWARWFQ